MAKPNSLKLNHTRYLQGGLTNTKPDKLGWWERRLLPQQYDDYRVEITKDIEKRPDLIAHSYYGKSVYAWVVLQYNHIVDIDEELVTGKVIRLPTYKRLVLEILTKTAG